MFHQRVVTAAQMQAIEARLFAAGMPVAALMEKVALRITAWIKAYYPLAAWPKVGILVGPGHNGGDALVVARELHHAGYRVAILCPGDRLKPLTQQHLDYIQHLGIPLYPALSADLAACDFWVDGLFGFGLRRSLDGDLAEIIERINTAGVPIISIDLPSGIATDSGAVLGQAIHATQTLCLGLWKRAFFQEAAVPYLGESHLIEFDIPETDIAAILGDSPIVQCITNAAMLAALPLNRSPIAHKYQMGNLLLVCGSQQYSGAAILAGLGARATGIGMLTIAVPASLKPLLQAQLPEALILACPETPNGTIAALPTDISRYSAIGVGCGLTPEPTNIVQQILATDHPVVLDADGLNMIASQPRWLHRSAPTILTPHLGEFRRLFPGVDPSDRLTAAQTAAAASGTIVLLKGARVAIADPTGQLRLNLHSTSALARGGSGDVLTGMIAGLLAQGGDPLELTAAAARWHAEAGVQTVGDRTVLGVDASHLAAMLIPTVARLQMTQRPTR